MEINFEVDQNLAKKLKLRAIAFTGLKIQPFNENLSREINSLCKKLAEEFPSSESARQILQPMRELYRSCGIDPTKIRPSSEALFRRAIKDKPLYQINSLVDTCNLCSLSFMLSIGLYDVEKISGRTISVRLGKAGESYKGIGKESINLDGRIALFDALGPFGNPSADSWRTRITQSTEKALFVVFAPASYDDNELKQHLNFIEKKVAEYHEDVGVIRF